MQDIIWGYSDTEFRRERYTFNSRYLIWDIQCQI